MTDIEEIDAAGLRAERDALVALLRACVADGASIGFVLPCPAEEAAAFWDGIAEALGTGARRMLVARIDGRIVGTAQLVLAMPANGLHRAEIAKLMVHPDARRRGIARMLMQRAEAIARALGRTLLVLDTEQGSTAEPLYFGLGFRSSGIVPQYARATDGCGFIATHIMYKVMEPARNEFHMATQRHS
jgi:GNAT superfamily N-acetyltransferase